MSRGVVTRLVTLAVTVVAGFGFILLDVVGWRAGAQRYPLTVDLVRAGGIYPEADVTYRGVTVGTVKRLDLAPDHVAVQIAVDPGVHIPSGSTATVKELSAAGEQYLDLVPVRTDAPWLRPHAVIPERLTALPIPIDTTLVDFGQLLGSVHTEDLLRLNTALSTGFGGNGQELRALVTQGGNLIRALRAAQPATVELQVGGRSVLQTAVATDTQFGSFARSLQQLSAQLRTSTPDFHALLVNGTAAETQLNALLAADSTSLEGVIGGLATSSHVAAVRNPSIAALFRALPTFATNLASLASGGQLHSEILLNTLDTVCPYLPGGQQPEPTQATAAPSLTLSCPTSASDLLQRGAAKAAGVSGG